MEYFGKRRIAVCGSSAGLSKPEGAFAERIGEALARSPNTILLSRGIKTGASRTAERPYAADWHFIEGAKRGMADDPLHERIETYVISGSKDSGRFTEGRILEARGRSGDARRFYMISKADALVAIAGEFGTNQQLTLANALDLPVLPLPFFGGAAADFWARHCDEIASRLRIDSTKLSQIEGSDPGTAGTADELASLLVSALEKRCFVIMPFMRDARLGMLFDDAIMPTLKLAGFRPLRLDRENIPGDVGRQIEQGISTCDLALAVLDHARPSVFYEMGLAHALRKPIVIVKSIREKEPVPFDISMQQRVDYDEIDDGFRNRLAQAIVASVNLAG